LIPLVAIASVDLPNVFSNGSVADADEVNANFQALLDESARYHMSPSVAGSRPIPDSLIQQLCEDADGCEVTALRAPTNDSPRGASERLHVTVFSGLGAWRTHSGSSGFDGNGSVEVVVISDGCGLLDGISGTGDPAIGREFFAGAADCFLTIAD
jgi:hypothetical protein